MASRQEITDSLRAGLNTVRARGQHVARVLRARTDVAVTRRRLHKAQAELGLVAFTALEAGQGLSPDDASVEPLLIRLRGLNVELSQAELALQQLLDGDGGAQAAASTPANEP
jgi:hypothetical protein